MAGQCRAVDRRVGWLSGCGDRLPLRRCQRGPTASSAFRLAARTWLPAFLVNGADDESVVGHQSIANAHVREQVARPNRIVLQLFAQLLHVDPQVVGVAFVRRPPYFA